MMNRFRLYAVLLSLHVVCAVMALPRFVREYTETEPLIIVGDWEKAPYEFQNDEGRAVGINIDIMDAVLKRLGVPYRYVLKDWSNALQTFERGEADIILANFRRYEHGDYFISRNVITYNRICAASLQSNASATTIPLEHLKQDGVVLNWGDYTSIFFSDSTQQDYFHVDYQSPKMALTGLLSGENRYYVWGEEPLKWKIKELKLNGIYLSEVAIPINEIHVIGRDRSLIEGIDDQYSRLMQTGEIERIQDHWLHPEREFAQRSPVAALVVLGVILLIILAYLIHRLTKTRVKMASSNVTDMNNMMMKALQMGDYHVMTYNIQRDLMTNRHGSLLSAGPMTLAEFSSHVHPEDRQEFERKMELLCSGRLRKTTLWKRWNDGTPEQPHWLELDGHAMMETDESGRPAYIINVIHDVTRDAEDRQELKELTKKYEALFYIPTIALSFYDKDGQLSELNQYMKDMCGFSDPANERFWRKSNMFDIPLFRNAYGPERRDDQLVCQSMEYADLGIKRYIEFHVHPIFGGDKELIGYFICSIDVTDDRDRDVDLRKKEKHILATNKQIAVLEQRLNYLLVNSHMYVWRLSLADQRINFTQSLREPGFSFTVDEYLQSLEGREREESAAWMVNHEQLMQPMTFMRRINYAPVTKEPRWFNIVSVPSKDEHGQLTGLFGLVRDITELMEAQRRLREETMRAQDSGRQKSLFLASMTHELRTPLNSIVGFSDLLRTVETTEERQEFIRIIRNNCDMLLRLINDILEVSSINDGPQSINPVQVDFATAFDDICQVLEERVQTPGVEFLKENPYDTFPTVLDIGRVQQIITNFVTNAVKYTDHGYIKVGYRLQQMVKRKGWTPTDGLYIYCEDTGAGIPQEQQDSVFDRFVKLNDFVQGTGLGLAICKSIAERFEGHIGVESRGTGYGSTFWFWVPCELGEKKS